MNVNQVKAARQLVFSRVREAIGVCKLPGPIRGFDIKGESNRPVQRGSSSAVVEVIIREQRLHQMAEQTVHLNLKTDGRPFWGNIFKCNN